MAGEFISYVGHQPWFFIPGKVAEGVTATVTGPSGSADVTEVASYSGGSFGDRVGVQVPVPWSEVGLHQVTITGPRGGTTVYDVDVREPDAPPALTLNKE